VQTLDALIRNLRPNQLEEQLVLAKKQVQHAETMLAVRGQQQPSVGQGIGDEESALRQDLAAAQAKMQPLADEVAALEQRFSGPDDGRADMLRLKLYEHELLRKYEEKEPLIAEVRQQIKRACEEMRKASADSDALEWLADQIVQARIALNRQQETADTAQKRLAQYAKRLQLLDGHDEALKRVEAELVQRKEQYQRLSAQLEGRTREGQGAVTVLEAPQAPLTSHRPDTLYTLLVAAALGLGSGLLYAILLPRYRSRR
jgi:chromosome segregation ATPase